jgi:AraC family transcriptional regulator
VLPPSLTEQRIPAGEFACVMQEGPYERLPDAWARLMGEWIPSSGRRIRPGGSYELYLNTPMDTAPGDLGTELRVPVEPE